ncbi:hypothetical protein [Dictyobacter formicarum]|uniref:Uncharacterized protein n=1 Tax=Dictyobacter formicarum TaxID=2778368 RepID=A0ABQ3VDI5_9CHLR|nr:hypothetical protein [Dictyobacter formicarum]GHO83977.1 hypothetical protein KSZ_19830 [Dictyobacter formicarum]
MTDLELPFDITDPDMKRGFENGQDRRYEDTRPITDYGFVDFIEEFLHLGGNKRLKYNIGFLLGLYIKR